MNEFLTLIKSSAEPEIRREVFARMGDIGMREFYQANASDFHPEAKFILADYLDYEGEKLLLHKGHLYRVMRTYRNGQELELTVESAPEDDIEEEEFDG